jgi:hypothetical protein
MQSCIAIPRAAPVITETVVPTGLVLFVAIGMGLLSMLGAPRDSASMRGCRDGPVEHVLGPCGARDFRWGRG